MSMRFVNIHRIHTSGSGYPGDLRFISYECPVDLHFIEPQYPGDSRFPGDTRISRIFENIKEIRAPLGPEYL